MGGKGNKIFSPALVLIFRYIFEDKNTQGVRKKRKNKYNP